MKNLLMDLMYIRRTIILLGSILVLFALFMANPFLVKSKKFGFERQVTAANVVLPFTYTFNRRGILLEADNMEDSMDPYWWLNSGGEMYYNGGFASTIQGRLPFYDNWRVAYSIDNPVDTDQGYRPQNIFRLVSRQKWQNISQSSYFMIKRDNPTGAVNRNESNGIFLFNRYIDGDNLYYVGIRVDGQAVIKKKFKGEYYTMAIKQVWPGTYHKNLSVDLLPKDQWIGLSSTVKNLNNGTVEIELWLDKNGNGSWEKALSAVDDGKMNGVAITTAGFTGIRVDYMDVFFTRYNLRAV